MRRATPPEDASRVAANARAWTGCVSTPQSGSGMPGRTIQRVDYRREFIGKRLGSLGLGPGSAATQLEDAGRRKA